MPERLPVCRYKTVEPTPGRPHHFVAAAPVHHHSQVSFCALHAAKEDLKKGSVTISHVRKARWNNSQSKKSTLRLGGYSPQSTAQHRYLVGPYAAFTQIATARDPSCRPCVFGGHLLPLFLFLHES